jgi:hypothetical protein
VTLVAILGELLRLLGIFDYNVLFDNPLMRRLGVIDNVLQVVIAINSVFLILFGIPMLLLLHDLKRTLRRFHVLSGGWTLPEFDSDLSYLQAAEEVFQRDDRVAVFIFGHTHAAFLKRQGPEGRVILNTGTWLKLLRRVPVRFGLLPAVYYPSYRLNYFCIEEQGAGGVIRYVEIPKLPGRELTWLQRVLTFGKAPTELQAIAPSTILNFK